MNEKKLNSAEVNFLYKAHGPALAAYACCRGVDFASGEDAVQQVFLKLLQASAPAPGNPVAYLYRAVKNSALNTLRNRGRDAELPDDELWFAHPMANPAEVLSLQVALRALPEDQRETVFLRVWSGMTLQEIAEATDSPLNTVASRYRYALEKLRAQLGEGAGKARMGHAKG